ncbi:transposon Tf2-9 polyprotein [Trichonephila inaurata madagascariensis]|uniref:Transposon Tf2-9 polyprotein n=1 Tax=Trichonephila inaurata madagascariensis TaxID=2747483 RepID=A0A8X6YIY1_9ARAC|nr:transposon Tf2-9 polyprotein [Trichonephila inaurata madagascariensis]
MAEVTAVKIPPYNFSDPQLWFSTCERTFALGVPKAITDTCTKFNYIVASLPPEAAAIIRNLIITPDETDPYGAIKAQLIQRTGESSQQEIRKLLTGEELGDRKPSELLRAMKNLKASSNVIFVQHHWRKYSQVQRGVENLLGNCLLSNDQQCEKRLDLSLE